MYFNRNEKILTTRRLQYFLASTLLLLFTLIGLGTLASAEVLGAWFNTGIIWSVLSGFALFASQIVTSIGLTPLKILTAIMAWLFLTAVHACISDISFAESWPGKQRIVLYRAHYSFREMLSQALRVALFGSEEELTDRGRRDRPEYAKKSLFVLLINPATWAIFFFEFLKIALCSFVYLFSGPDSYTYPPPFRRKHLRAISWGKFFVSFLFSLLLLPLKGLAGICNLPYWICRVPHVIDLQRKEKRDKAEKAEMDAFLDTLLQENPIEDSAIGFQSKSGKSKAQRAREREQNYRDWYSEERREGKRRNIRSGLQDQWDSIHELQHEIVQFKRGPHYPGRDIRIRKAEACLETAKRRMLQTIAYLKGRAHFQPLLITDIADFLSEANRYIEGTRTAIADTKALQANDYRCWMPAIKEFEFSEAKKILEALKERSPVYLTQSTPERDTPLHYAAKKGRIDIMPMLFREQGADSTFLNREGQTAFQVLAQLHPAKYKQLLHNYAAYSGSKFTSQPKQTTLLSDLYQQQPERYKTYLAQEGCEVLCIHIPHAPNDIYLSLPRDAWSNAETAIHAAKRRIRGYRAYLAAYRKFCSKAGIPCPPLPVLPEDLEKKDQYAFLILPRGCCALSGVDQDLYMQETTQKRALLSESMEDIPMPTALVALMQGYAQNEDPFQGGSFAEIALFLAEAKEDEDAIPSPACPYASVMGIVAQLQALDRYLVPEPAKLEKKHKGETLLLWAAKNGHLSVVERLLKRGADIETKDWWGYTPLHRAAEKGHDAVVELLLRSGANREAKTEQGVTILDIYVQREYKAFQERVKIQLAKMQKFQTEGYSLGSELHNLLMKTYTSPFLTSKKNIQNCRDDIGREQKKMTAAEEKWKPSIDKRWAYRYISVSGKSSESLQAEIATMQVDIAEGKIWMQEMKVFLQEARANIEKIKQMFREEAVKGEKRKERRMSSVTKKTELGLGQGREELQVVRLAPEEDKEKLKKIEVSLADYNERMDIEIRKQVVDYFMENCQQLSPFMTDAASASHAAVSPAAAEEALSLQEETAATFAMPPILPQDKNRFLPAPTPSQSIHPVITEERLKRG